MQATALRIYEKYGEIHQALRTELAAGKGRYWYRRLHERFKALGWMVPENVIRRLMKEEGLLIPNMKSQKYGSCMGEISQVVENVL